MDGARQNFSALLAPSAIPKRNSPSTIPNIRAVPVSVNDISLTQIISWLRERNPLAADINTAAAKGNLYVPPPGVSELFAGFSVPLTAVFFLAVAFSLTVYMYNTPVYDGDRYRKAELSFIYIIGHGDRNITFSTGHAEAITAVMANCIQHHWDTALIGRLTGAILKMINLVNVKILQFVPDSTVVSFIENDES